MIASAKAFRRAVGYFPAVRRNWLKGVACIPFASGLDIFVVFIVGDVVRDMERGDLTMASVAWRAALVMGLVLLKGAGKFGMRWYVTGASRDFERLYRQDLFDHLVRLSPHDLAHVRTGDIMSRSVADVEAVRMLLGPAVMYNLQAAVVVPAVLVAMAVIDASLMAAMLLPLVGLALVIKMAAKPTQRWAQVAQERLADLSTVAQESFSGVRVVKAFATEALSSNAFRVMGESLLGANLRLATIRGVTSASITSVKELGILVIVLVGGWHAVEGRIDTANLLQFVMLLNLALWPLVAVGWMLGMYHRAVTAAERLEALFTLEPSVREAARPVEPHRNVRQVHPDHRERGAVKQGKSCRRGIGRETPCQGAG